MKKLVKKYEHVCQKVVAWVKTPQGAQVGLFLLGVLFLTTGLVGDAMAYEPKATYNGDRFDEATDVILTYLNGSFGALVMVASGIGTIVSGAFGQYRAALGLMVVAVGSFIIRSLVSTFFNTEGLKVQ